MDCPYCKISVFDSIPSGRYCLNGVSANRASFCIQPLSVGPAPNRYPVGDDSKAVSSPSAAACPLVDVLRHYVICTARCKYAKSCSSKREQLND